jgi:hypothetical protein
MTERPAAVAAAREAQARGEAATAAGDTSAEAMQADIAGSDVVVDPAFEETDKIAVQRTDQSVHPAVIPPPPTSSANVDNSYGNSQSQSQRAPIRRFCAVR